jgi:preflagellin peptidase FlaK
VDAFALARLVVGAAFLAAAAALDLRTRRVQDPLWITLGTVGIIVLAIDIANSYGALTSTAAARQWLILASAAILFYAVFFGKPILDEDGVRLRPLRVLTLAAAAAAFFAGVLLPDPLAGMFLPAGARILSVIGLATVPILILVYQGLFQLGLLRGGADAKAMITLALLIPLYPDASPFPLLAEPANVRGTMELLFPFSLTVLVDAAILFLAVPLAYFVINAVRSELEMPQAFFGTKASLDRLPPHVWLMERVDRRGERIAVLFPARRQDESEDIAKLRAAGADRVWVQPKVPFMVPLLAGFLLAFFAGNLMLAFLTAILPHA